MKSGTVKESIPNLYYKEKHANHYRNLKLSLKLGTKLKKMCSVRI